MQTAVWEIDESFKCFRLKNRQIFGSECGDVPPVLKCEHVRALHKLFWFACQIEANCVTFLCETQTAKIEPA
jgi:hypothetical protein